MAGSPDAVLRQVGRLFGAGTVAGLAEGQLLDRFLARGDEVAFEALLTRLGPMVLGVCRRTLRDPHDVEDAFQATFLILVRRGGTLRDRDLLAPWLHRVALRVALRAGVEAARRRKHAAIDAGAIADRRPGPPPADLRPAIDEELARLPEKYRAPVVLCDLEGRTHEEAARQLRWPVGTVKGRLSRARDLLRGRLARRGLAPSAGLLAATLAGEARATVPEVLSASTIRAATAVAAGGGLTAGMVPATAAALVHGVTRGMIMTKLKVLAAGTLAVGVIATGAGVLARQAAGPRPPAPGGSPPGITLARQGGGGGPANPAASEPGTPAQPKAEDGPRGAADAADDLFLRLEEARIQLDIVKKEIQERKQAWIEQATSIARAERALKDAPDPDNRIPTYPNQTRAQVEQAVKNSREVLKSTKQKYLEKVHQLQRFSDEVEELQRQSAPPVRGQGSGTVGANRGMGGYGMGMGGMMGGGSGGMGGGFGGGMGGGAGGFGMGMGGVGMGGGMGGGGFLPGSNPGDPRSGRIETSAMIVTQPAGGDRVSAYNMETGTTRTYKLSPKTTAKPVASQQLVALYLKGEEVPQIAAYSALSGDWYPKDLRTPAKGQAVPVVGADAVFYTVGRRVYAFAGTAAKWGVLELEDGAEPHPAMRSTSIMVEEKGRVHVFNYKLGRWDELDAKDR